MVHSILSSGKKRENLFGERAEDRKREGTISIEILSIDFIGQANDFLFDDFFVERLDDLIIGQRRLVVKAYPRVFERFVRGCPASRANTSDGIERNPRARSTTYLAIRTINF